MVTLDVSTLSIMGTIAASSAGSAWWVGRMLRAVETSLSSKLDTHETEDREIFKEHGLRLQRLELHEFGFTAVGKDVVLTNPLPEPVGRS